MIDSSEMNALAAIIWPPLGSEIIKRILIWYLFAHLIHLVSSDIVFEYYSLIIWQDDQTGEKFQSHAASYYLCVP